MYFVQLRIAPQNPKTPHKRELLIGSLLGRDLLSAFTI